MNSVSYSIHTALVKGTQGFTEFEVFPVPFEWECIDTGIW